MKFEQIRMFNWFFALIPLIIIMVIHYFVRFPALCRLITHNNAMVSSDKEKKPKKINRLEKEIKLRYVFSSFFLIVFFCLIILTFADPRAGTILAPELRRGTDIVLAFDVSRSMNVRDAASIDGSVSSSRLERSVWIAKNLIAFYQDSGKNMNVRFGVAIGKGAGVLAVPLTDDTEAVLALLDSLFTLPMTSIGTNLENLLDAAGGAFPENFPTGREVLLFTDGEELSGSLSAALERLHRANINVIAIGSGSIYGAQVPEIHTTEQNATVRTTTRKPAPIQSYLRSAALQSAAERVGGSYIDGNRPEAALAAAEEIGPLSAESSWVFREKSGSLWHIFLVFALIALALSKICTKRFKGIVRVRE